MDIIGYKVFNPNERYDKLVSALYPVGLKNCFLKGDKNDIISLDCRKI